MAGNNPKSLLERPMALLIHLLLLDLIFVAMFPISTESRSWTLIRWFDLDNESSIATWYSSSQLLISGLLVLLTSSFRDPAVSPSRAFCVLVALGLIFLSADEASMIHERLTPLAAKYAGFIPLFPGNHGAWIFIYGVIGLLLVALSLGNILSLWKHQRRALMMFCIGFATLVTGAVMVEVAGYYSLIASEAFQIMIEEGLEMIGGSIILVGAAIFFNSHVSLRTSASDKHDAVQTGT